VTGTESSKASSSSKALSRVWTQYASPLEGGAGASFIRHADDKVIHKVSVGQAGQQARRSGFSKDAPCCDGGNEINEFLSDQSKVPLYIGFVETFIVFVSSKCKFEFTSVFITEVDRLSEQVLVGFEYNDTKRLFFL
jgi:hypothetical protein